MLFLIGFVAGALYTAEAVCVYWIMRRNFDAQHYRHVTWDAGHTGMAIWMSLYAPIALPIVLIMCLPDVLRDTLRSYLKGVSGRPELPSQFTSR